MILADTSAWIEYDRKTGRVVDRRMAELIAADTPPVVTEPILMEVLAGARDDARAAQLRRLLLRGGLVPLEASTDFESAARIYRRCQDAGVTPRGMIDCLIAAVALRTESTILCRDVDLERIGDVMGIAIDKPTRR